MQSTVIVVPCYNEAGRLNISAFTSFLDSHDGISFLFVDDGSTDGTDSILKDLLQHDKRLSILQLDCNSGKGEAIRRGVMLAMEGNPQYVGFWDSDLATPLNEIEDFIQTLDVDSTCEMVFGARVNLLGRNVKRGLSRHYAGRIFATFAANVLKLPIYDTQCGAKIFRVNNCCRLIFAEPFFSKWIFDVEIVARLIKARQGTDQRQAKDVIVEYPLRNWQETDGSKLRLADKFVVGSYLLRIYRKYTR